MFYHPHPFPPFIPKGTQRLIVGTLPPPRFSGLALRPKDVNFCYGSDQGMLWKVLDQIYQLDLTYKNTEEAIIQRKAFLERERIGICDLVKHAYRQKIDASDLGLTRIVLRDLLEVLKDFPQVVSLIFTGGNSKNGPEYFFRQLLKKQQVQLVCIEETPPRKHQFYWADRLITTYSLTAPSGSANRAIGQMAAYKKAKQNDTNYTTFDFRVAQYRSVFKIESI